MAVDDLTDNFERNARAVLNYLEHLAAVERAKRDRVRVQAVRDRINGVPDRFCCTCGHGFEACHRITNNCSWICMGNLGTSDTCPCTVPSLSVRPS